MGLLRLLIINLERITERTIQLIGITAKNGKWHCPFYCYQKNDYRDFRCDRMLSAECDKDTVPIDLSNINLKKPIFNDEEA
jgi:predicted DNA-binding transcriptional regulator YafY